MSEQYGGPWNSPAGGGARPQAQPYGGPPPQPYSEPQPQPYGGPPPQAYGEHAGQPVYPGHPYPGYVPTPLPLRDDYASWGKRVAAYLIDSIPSFIGAAVFNVGYVQVLLTAVQSGDGTLEFGPGAPAMIVGGILLLAGTVWNIFNRWLTAGRTGQSMGKRVMKIALIGEDTNVPIGPLNAFLRDLVHTLDSFAYVGYLWPLWDERRQTFSDKIMKTVVIKAPSQAG